MDWWTTITDGIGSVIETLNGWVSALRAVNSEFILFLRTTFGFLPEELITLISISIGIGIVWLVIKVIRG